MSRTDDIKPIGRQSVADDKQAVATDSRPCPPYPYRVVGGKLAIWRSTPDGDVDLEPIEAMWRHK